MADTFEILGISYYVDDMGRITLLDIEKKDGGYQKAIQHLAITQPYTLSRNGND